MAKGDAKDGVSFQGEEGSFYKVGFPALCVLVNEGKDHGEVTNDAGWADCFVCYGCWVSFVLPNVDRFAITNPPPYAFTNHFKAAVDTTLCIRWIATQLGIEDI